LEPEVVRGNAGEISALLAHLAPRGEGEAATYLAREVGTVVIQTGETDLITDGYNNLQVANGHPLMTRVTAMGCAASALVAAFLAVQRDAFSAAVEALLTLGVAGELAGKKADGPGSFQINILDQLYSLDDQRLQRHARVNPLSTKA
jgi:hydroxyethylthiazole kinase